MKRWISRWIVEVDVVAGAGDAVAAWKTAGVAGVAYGVRAAAVVVATTKVKRY